MASPTPNKGYTYPAHGGSVNAWDTPLNTNFDYIDLNVGGQYAITVTSTATTATYASSVATLSSTVATATIPSSLAQNLYYAVTGVLTRNLTIAFPAVGGFYNVNNQTTGAFTVSANTVAVGSSGSTIPQTEKVMLVSDGTNVYQGTTVAQAKFLTLAADPNGLVAGRVGGTGGYTDSIYDVTHKQLYLCTTTGAAAAAVWSPQISRVTPQGILTARNSTTFPVLTANALAVSTMYYTPYCGNWTVLSDGNNLYPYQFSRFTLTLVAGHAANQIYDVYMYANPTAGIINPIIGTGPTWTAGAGGSVTAGACARGTGGGSTELTVLQGVLVNNVQVTLTNGGSSFTCPAQQGVYLGSIWMDSSNGNITCNRTVGQARKFSIWNYYNRLPIVLQARDTTASWTYGGGYRASNGDSDNKASAFCGVDEEMLQAVFVQNTSDNQNSVATIGIGENSTTTASLMQGSGDYDGVGAFGYPLTASVTSAPQLGIWNFQCLEKFGGVGAGAEFAGAAGMLLTVSYRG